MHFAYYLMYHLLIQKVCWLLPKCAALSQVLEIHHWRKESEAGNCVSEFNVESVILITVRALS